MKTKCGSLPNPETAYAGPLSAWSSSGIWVSTVPMAWRPAQRSVWSCWREQMLPRWRWSIAKDLGSVTPMLLTFASPERVQRSNRRRGFRLLAVAFLLPNWRTAILGLNGRVAQLTAWNLELKLETVP